MPVSYMIHITGQVQGVGFRPYVYNLAVRCGIKGYVSNNEKGVVILAQGQTKEIKNFDEELVRKPPPLARIREHFIEECDEELHDDFSIRPSSKNDKLNLQLTPDFGICDECRKELTEVQNRRFGYPFTTCVNCGPRWSLTHSFPFERENTSLREFAMCWECSDEYEDPANRRFHSQTNSCATCGISLMLCDSEGQEIEFEEKGLFKKVARLLSQGHIIAIKNTGGYLLCCDADNAEAIGRLRKRKRRPEKPFALMYPSMETLLGEISVNDLQKGALESTARPIVILPVPNDYEGTLALNGIAPGLRQLGVMMPYSGVLELLASELTRPVIATSGNLHGSPIISEDDEAMILLKEVADYFVHHDLNIANPQDDSVVKFTEKDGLPVVFRRSRGFAPNFFDFHITSGECVMAMGSQLKSTLAFVPNEYLYVSQYLGNLDHYDVYHRFLKTTHDLIRIFEQPPRSILIDSHPEYLSSTWGKELAARHGAILHKVQHHKAHFASVLGEHGLFDQNEPVLGVIWDGTGYGDDQQIWGGEFFLFHDKSMSRFGHIEYFDWLSGDKMAREPRLSLFSLNEGVMTQAIASKFTEEEIRVYTRRIQSNQLKTSSVGRLFDAVASLLGICDHNSYEGEAAILLENSIGSYEIESCRPLISVGPDGTISGKELISKISDEMDRGAEVQEIAINFLYTLAYSIKEMADLSGVRKVAFSGGVFQNCILIDMVQELLKGNFETYFNVNLAPNDENISYGQLMYYLNGIGSNGDKRENG